jgi:hypothetical protein
MGMGYFLEVRRPGREFNLSPPSRAEKKNEWSSNFTYEYVFMVLTGKTFLLFGLIKLRGVTLQDCGTCIRYVKYVEKYH